MEIRTILVPTDFSEPAAHALDYAVGLAKLFHSQLHLVHAYQIPVQLGIGEPVPLPQEYFDELRTRAQQHLSELTEKAKSQGVEAQGDLIQDAPAHAICEAAKLRKADLIVMGTRGLTGMKHVLLGSVAERTVRSAPCPVLTVRSSEQ